MSIVLSNHATDFATSFAAELSHAVLLSGPRGVGLRTFATHLAVSGTLLAVVEPVAKTPKGQPIISVERIRELYEQTRTRLDGRHFVIIDDADKMNHSAQNALLKLLEEPNPSIHFLLTSHAPDQLLPTIRSRSWHVALPPIDDISSHRLLKSLGVTDETRRTQLLYVANGLPAELTRLSQKEAGFEQLVDDIKRARRFVEGTAYDRLIIANELKDDREVALRFIDTTIMLLKRGVGKTADSNSTLRMIDRLLEAYSRIKANGNVRLQLAAAVL